MWGWFSRRKERNERRKEAEMLRRLDRAELQRAVNNLDYRRNNIEALMARMLEERRA